MTCILGYFHYRLSAHRHHIQNGDHICVLKKSMFIIKGYADYSDPCFEIISRYLKVKYYSTLFSLMELWLVYYPLM